MGLIFLAARATLKEAKSEDPTASLAALGRYAARGTLDFVGHSSVPFRLYLLCFAATFEGEALLGPTFIFPCSYVEC
jgi:hypothetical protein